MAPPKDAQHRDAADKGWHILESRQERHDVIGDLLRGDHQHRDGKRKRCIDESFEPRHLNPAQPKPVQPRQRIEVCRQCRRDVIMAIVHFFHHDDPRSTCEFPITPIKPSSSLIETRSSPDVARCYPHSFAFYVAPPSRSVLTSHFSFSFLLVSRPSCLPCRSPTKAGHACLLANGANGMRDIEGKVAREAMSECGQRASFNISAE